LDLTPRQFQVIELAVIAAAAFECALIANARLERALLAPPSRLPPELAERRRSTPLPLDGVALARLFGFAPPEPTAIAGQGATGSPKGAAALPALRVELMATTVGDPVELSWAILRELDAARCDVVLLGDPILDGALVEVGEGYVVIARGDQLERVELGVLPRVLTSSAEGPAPTAALIERSGSTITVRQELVQHVIANPGEAINEVRFRPHMDGGALKGFRVEYLKPGSLLSLAGLKGDDVVERINGNELNSVENALGLLASLRTARRVEVELLRGGQPTSYVIEVQP
jgi:general secretion pathway protein C